MHLRLSEGFYDPIWYVEGDEQPVQQKKLQRNDYIIRVHPRLAASRLPPIQKTQPLTK